MELFKRQSGVDLVHVPYKDSAPALIDLVAGRLQAMFDNVPNVLPQVRGGRLRAVAAVLRDQGVEPVGGSPEQFALHLRTQVEKWGTLARAAAIRLD
jgi:tripartite-type tricarboxylate transporter receptor subunit TctC